MTPDPLRSLDAVDPPDQWDDIVARAEPGNDRAFGLGEARIGGGRSHRMLSAAALLVVVAAVVAGLVVAGGGSDRAGEHPRGIWGHQWQLVRVDIGEGAITTGLSDPEGEPIRLDARDEGRVEIQVCNLVSAEATIEGGRLRLGDGMQTAAACLDPLGELIQIDGTKVERDGSRLVLRRTDRPQAEYTFVRTDALTPSQEFWGRTWRVTSVTDRSGRRTEERTDTGPLLDAHATGRLLMRTCGEPAVKAALTDDRLDLDGTWKPSSKARGDCLDGPEHDVIRQVLAYDDTTIDVKGKWLTVRSKGGELTAVATATVLGPGLFGHRWVVAAVGAPGKDPRVPDGFFLTATTKPRTITVPGCGTKVGGPATLAQGVLTIEVAPPNPLGDCADALGPNKGWLALWDFFREYFAGPLDLSVSGQRATIATDTGVVTLVRVD